jgi:predicted HTH transcriptional regulator
MLDRLDSENRAFAMMTAKNRLERERVNAIAMREAVMNSIVHDYYSKGAALVEIFTDRIVVTSCGGLKEMENSPFCHIQRRRPEQPPI